ncbi:MAG: hypothetical protein LBD72_00235, partial [Puniceicoccales bacterium]|nr:hypothetical protein [Puniceicoccales bacterium]
ELELELEPTKKPAEELPKGLTEELTEEPGPPQDIPSRKDIASAYREFVDSLLAVGEANASTPFPSEAAPSFCLEKAKRALQVLCARGIQIPRMVDYERKPVRWQKPFLTKILASDDPEFRKLGRIFLSNSADGVSLLVGNSPLCTGFFASLSDEPKKDEMRKFFMENPRLVKWSLFRNPATVVRIFASLNCLTDILQNNDFDNFFYLLRFADTKYVMADFVEGIEAGELCACCAAMLRNPKTRGKYLAMLGENIHYRRKVCGPFPLSSIFIHGCDALDDFCQKDPKAFVKFVIFSPNSFVREKGTEAASRHLKFGVPAYVRKNPTLFIRQVLAMGDPFIGDGYEFLEKHGLFDVVFAGDDFMELVLKSLDSNIAASGISFIVRNKLSQRLFQKCGREIIQFILEGGRNTRLGALLCAIARSNEVSSVLRSEPHGSFFDQFSKKILSSAPNRIQLQAITSLANAFGRPDIAKDAQDKLAEFPCVCFKQTTCEVQPEKVLALGSFSNMLSYDMVGRQALEYVQLQHFQPQNNIANLAAYIEQEMNKCYPGEMVEDRLAKEQQVYQSMARKFYASNSKFNVNSLYSADDRIRRGGYDALGKEFPGVLSWKKILPPKVLPTLCPFLLLSTQPLDIGRDSLYTESIDAKRCVDVCADALNFFKQWNILDDVLLTPTDYGVPFFMLLLLSPDGKQREIGYNLMKNNMTQENVQFFAQMVLNSCDAEICKAGINFLKSIGISHVEIDDEIYKLAPY